MKSNRNLEKMKTTLSVFAIVICISLCACKKNDDSLPAEITLQPEPPLSFNLMDVPHESIDVGLTPKLSWESAKNPKGAEVSYDLYVDQSLDPKTLVKGDISGTSFEIDEHLEYLSQYHWKVVATDSEGQTSQSPIHSFTTRYYTFPEELVIEDAAFAKRYNHKSTVFNDKLWMIGGNAAVTQENGSHSSEPTNEVWSSDDGKNWTLVLKDPPFEARYFHSVATFNNKLWVLCGTNHSTEFSDIWSSEDGIAWSLEAISTFGPNVGINNHSTVVFDNKLWVIAGTDHLDNFTNWVWYSTDGSNWTNATNEANFSKRTNMASVVFQNKMWVIGGFDGEGRKNDVWSSEDGINWDLVTANADFSPRNAHEAVVFDNKIWIIGGYVGESGDETNEVWYSANGIDWTQLNVPDSFTKNAQFSATVFKNQIWVIGGIEDGDQVWATH